MHCFIFIPFTWIVFFLSTDIYQNNKKFGFGSTLKEDENQKPTKKTKKKKVKKSAQLIREEKMNVSDVIIFKVFSQLFGCRM